jgi:hypothetical protein
VELGQLNAQSTKAPGAEDTGRPHADEPITERYGGSEVRVFKSAYNVSLRMGARQDQEYSSWQPRAKMVVLEGVGAAHPPP